MSLAWGSLVLLIVLLPGVLFFVGQYLPERFTRETVERSALGQLAGTLLISLVTHGTLYCLSASVCGGRIPCIDLSQFLSVLLLDKADKVSIAAAATSIAAYRWWILAYVGGTAALGLLGGFLAGQLVVRGRLRFLAQHHWVYRLSPGDGFTVAYVMTRVQHEERVLMYRGFLESFHLRKDGRFSYLVLTGARRFYMSLDKQFPATSGRPEWKTIGDSTRAIEATAQSDLPSDHLHDEMLFVIEGEDVSNVVLDRYAVQLPPSLSDQDFERLAEAARKVLESKAAQAAIFSAMPLARLPLELALEWLKMRGSVGAEADADLPGPHPRPPNAPPSA